MIEIIGMEEIMKDYNLTRAEATGFLKTKGCPALPRKKRGRFKIVRHKWEEWLENQKVK